MTVIRKKQIDKAFEIYRAVYQGLTNDNEDKDAYRKFSRDLFDLHWLYEARQIHQDGSIIQWYQKGHNLSTDLDSEYHTGTGELLVSDRLLFDIDQV